MPGRDDQVVAEVVGYQMHHAFGGWSWLWWISPHLAGGKTGPLGTISSLLPPPSFVEMDRRVQYLGLA